MIPDKDFPQLYGKITVQGKESQGLISFIGSLEMNHILSADTASVVICTDKGAVLDGKHYAIAYPYYKGFKKSEITCKKILTYAVEDDSADVVAKNIRKRDGFVTFELLAQSGIGRVYLGESDKEAPVYALALACGLILSGISFKDTIALVSKK